MLAGYDPYAGYYNQDGTTAYAYDPNTYTAPATSAAPAEAAATVPTATEAAAEGTAAATVVVPLPAAAAITPADAAATASDAPVKPAPLPADQTAAAAQEIGAEHAANLLSVDEKQNLEQQQEAAETARKEAEDRYQKAEEQRRNAKVVCTPNRCQSDAASYRYHLHAGMHSMYVHLLCTECTYMPYIPACICLHTHCCTEVELHQWGLRLHTVIHSGSTTHLCLHLHIYIHCALDPTLLLICCEASLPMAVVQLKCEASSSFPASIVSTGTFPTRVCNRR